MVEQIQAIFFDPPIAISRLGGSSVPQDAYTWTTSPDPRSGSDTAVVPTWSLTVLPDGAVEPVKPSALQFRDGQLIRPVCPFFELWALLGEPGSDPADWREAAITPDLLAQHGANLGSLAFRLDAKNLKAARRTLDPALAYGTFDPVELRGDDHVPHPILAVSPPNATTPMIPLGRNIPLGSFQVLKPSPAPADPTPDWAEFVDISLVRVRFTPARGRFYGPPSAAQMGTAPPFPAVPPENAFLNPAAGWLGAPMSDIVEPADTFDGAETRRRMDPNSGRSRGVVDDTCEARIQVILELPGPRQLSAHANVFVAPPDFAPDRRPFLSIADELVDRAGDNAARSAALSANDRQTWVGDLFERIYETVTLMNVDTWRAQRGLEPLTGARLRPQPIPADAVPRPRQAMGGRDTLRNPDEAIVAPSENVPLPLWERARTRHHELADVEALRNFVQQRPGRLQSLIRGPFEVEPGENGESTTMRMPPFMRQSNALPLTLSGWQYALLNDWVRSAEGEPLVAAVQPVAAVLLMSVERASVPTDEANARRDEVLARLERGSDPDDGARADDVRA